MNAIDVMKSISDNVKIPQLFRPEKGRKKNGGDVK